MPALLIVRTDAGSFPTTTMSVGSNASNMFFGCVDGTFDDGGGPDVPFDVGAPMFFRRASPAFKSLSVRPWL